MQILLDARDYSRIRKAASSEKKSTSEWVRGLIKDYLTGKTSSAKEDPIKILAGLNLPAPPIEQMLREIEEGRK